MGVVGKGSCEVVHAGGGDDNADRMIQEGLKIVSDLLAYEEDVFRRNYASSSAPGDVWVGRVHVRAPRYSEAKDPSWRVSAVSKMVVSSSCGMRPPAVVIVSECSRYLKM